MHVFQRTIQILTTGRGLTDVTSAVAEVVAAAAVHTALCTVFVRHTSASLVVQENADPAVLRDLAAWMERLAPEDARAYEHDAEGPDDMEHRRSKWGSACKGPVRRSYITSQPRVSLSERDYGPIWLPSRGTGQYADVVLEESCLLVKK